MSNTNTVADLDVRIHGLSNQPFWFLSEHNAYYVYLDRSHLHPNNSRMVHSVLAFQDLITITISDFSRRVPPRRSRVTFTLGWAATN